MKFFERSIEFISKPIVEQVPTISANQKLENIIRQIGSKSDMKNVDPIGSKSAQPEKLRHSWEFW